MTCSPTTCAVLAARLAERCGWRCEWPMRGAALRSTRDGWPNCVHCGRACGSLPPATTRGAGGWAETVSPCRGGAARTCRWLRGSWVTIRPVPFLVARQAGDVAERAVVALSRDIPSPPGERGRVRGSRRARRPTAGGAIWTAHATGPDAGATLAECGQPGAVRNRAWRERNVGDRRRELIRAKPRTRDASCRSRSSGGWMPVVSADGFSGPAALFIDDPVVWVPGEIPRVRASQTDVVPAGCSAA